MKKRKFILGIAAITLVTSLGISSKTFADEDLYEQPSLRAGGGWYYSTITLPRGGPWWSTVERKATVVNQGTGVNKPAYLVRARITTNKPDEALSGPETHPAGADSVRWHYTNRKGAIVRAGFANSVSSTYTNRVNLRWNP